MIFRMASFSSEDSFRSGATEKKREKRGSVSINRMKITALLKVLKFFRAISSSTVSKYRFPAGSTVQNTAVIRNQA